MTVWIPEATNNRETYHTRKCRVVKQHKTRKITKDAAERMGLRLCKECNGTDETKTENDMSYYNALKEHAND